MRKVFWENGSLIEAAHFHSLEAWVEELCRCSGLIGSRYGLIRDIGEKTWNVFRKLNDNEHASIRLSNDQTGLGRNEVRIDLSHLRAILPGGNVVEVGSVCTFELQADPREPTPLFLRASGRVEPGEKAATGVTLCAHGIELATSRQDRSIPVAVLQKTGDSFDETFIPPSVTIGSSDLLWECAREVLARIDHAIARSEGLLYKLAADESPGVDQRKALEFVRLMLATWRAVRPRLDDPYLPPLSFLDDLDRFLQAVRRDWRGLSLALGALIDDPVEAFVKARDEGVLRKCFATLHKLLDSLEAWVDDLGERFGEVARKAIAAVSFEEGGDWHETTITFTQTLRELKKKELDIWLSCEGADKAPTPVVINPTDPPRRKPKPESQPVMATQVKGQNWIRFKHKPSEEELESQRLKFYVYVKEGITPPRAGTPWQGVLKIKGLTDA